ncbi:MAG TPA: isoprenylcysteine carboxylmethyltransferase family protein [Myxococcaceae bacterium]|nr:isoprenylcysteine carboxylmethyltransferase family protein [Myxococcaceae bacterium]
MRTALAAGAAGLLALALVMLAVMANRWLLDAFLLAALSGALCAGEIMLAPEPRLPVGVTHRAPGWTVPAAVTGTALLAIQIAAAVSRELRLPALAAAGAALMVLGGLLRLWAMHTLGEAFRTEHEIHEGQELVRAGPYAFARHPSEIGLLAFALGAAAVTRSWPAAAIWALALLPASLLRLRREEALLRAAFKSPEARPPGRSAAPP